MILSVVTFRNLSLRSAEFHFRSLSRPKGSPLPQSWWRFRTNRKFSVVSNFREFFRRSQILSKKVDPKAEAPGANRNCNRKCNRKSWRALHTVTILAI